MTTSLIQSPSVAAGLVLAVFICVAVFVRNKQSEAQALKNGFAPPPRFRAKDPFMGLDYVIQLFGDAHYLQRNRLQYGKTFIIKPWVSATSIVTSEPDNIQKVFASVDNDYSVNWRKEPFIPFTGQGILTEDGNSWRVPRKLYRPGFAKSNIANFEFYAKIVDDLINKIPVGKSIDMHPILLKAFMDSALHFTIGYDTMNPHEDAPLSRDAFTKIWEDGMQGIGLRVVTGRLSWLLPMRKFKESCIKVHDFVDFHIKKASAAEKKTGKDQVGVDILLAQTEDRTLVRNMLVQGIIGAQDTTSVLTSNTIRALSRNPALWKELREEVLKHGSDLFTYDALRSNEVLQNILSESLRLYPVFPAMDRVAVRDTVLPTGGGPSGTSPILVKAGTRVQASFFALHRESSVYGDEVESYNPHRWKTIKPGQWEFMAFGAGPRNCMGRDKSLAEAAYILAKLAGRFERLESRDERDWVGAITFTSACKFGCQVAFHE